MLCQPPIHGPFTIFTGQGTTVQHIEIICASNDTVSAAAESHKVVEAAAGNGSRIGGE